MERIAISMNKFAVSLFLLSMFMTPYSASVAGISSFDGTYKLDDAESDNIDTAIDQGVSKLNFLVRHIARDRLKKLNPEYRSVSIVSSNGEISIVVDSQPALKMPTDGSTVVWSSPAGEKTRVNVRFEGGHLLQEFNSSDGRRLNDYTLSADARILTMLVTETSPRLSAPIKYKQVYRRIT